MTRNVLRDDDKVVSMYEQTANDDESALLNLEYDHHERPTRDPRPRPDESIRIGKDDPEVPATIAEVQRIYANSIFPERKADWRVYPNNIGHKDWPGCFRCHDDKHKTSLGQKVRSSDCNSCHIIIAQGKGEQLETLSAKGLKFAHPDGELDAELTCTDCHNGGIQK